MSTPDMDSLILALTSALYSIRNYYDRTTGEVVTISDEFGAGELDGPSEHYELITPLSVSERFQIMEDFVESLDNEDVQDELNQALTEKGAFLRFDEALSRYPRVKTSGRSFARIRCHSMLAHGYASMGSSNKLPGHVDGSPVQGRVAGLARPLERYDVSRRWVFE